MHRLPILFFFGYGHGGVNGKVGEESHRECLSTLNSTNGNTGKPILCAVALLHGPGASRVCPMRTASASEAAADLVGLHPPGSFCCDTSLSLLSAATLLRWQAA